MPNDEACIEVWSKLGVQTEKYMTYDESWTQPARQSGCTQLFQYQYNKENRDCSRSSFCTSHNNAEQPAYNGYLQILIINLGAGGGTRTHTMSPSADFESATSTIPSHRHAVEKYISFEAKYQVFCCDFSYPLPAVPVQPAMDVNAI